jgi:glycosyltransferase involved in cell wall biosynthesis
MNSAAANQSAQSERPFLSIVTACYNAAATIEDTILSLRSQQGVKFEHIIVDGGSKDDTMAIVDKYRDGFSYVLSEKDRGVYDAMQKGLMQARGMFTGFLNADDFYASTDTLARLASTLKTEQYFGVSGVVEQIDTTGKVRRVIGRKPVSEADILWGKFPPHPGTLMRTDLMRQAGGFKHDYRIAGDFDLFLRVRKLTSQKMAHVDWPVTKMRMGGLSTGNAASNYVMVGDELFRALSECGYRASRLKMQTRLLKKFTELM